MSLNVSKLDRSPLPDITRNRHGGNQFSEEANARVHSRKEADRDRVLKLAEARGEYGITTLEVAGAFGKTPNQVSGRLSELKRDGLLVPSGIERDHSAVLIVPKKGQQKLFSAE